MEQNENDEEDAPADGIGDETPPPPAATHSWARVVSGFSKQGASLKFVPPKIVEGKLMAELQASEIEAGNKKWEHKIVVYVVGFVPSIAALRNYFKKTWTMVSIVDLFKHDHGFFLLKCATDGDMHSILDSGPSFYKSRPIIMKPWKPDFDYNADMMRTMPL